MPDEDEIEKTIRDLLYEHLDTETEEKASRWLNMRVVAYTVLSEMGVMDGIDDVVPRKKPRKKS